MPENSLTLMIIWSHRLMEWGVPFHQTKAWKALARQHKGLMRSIGKYRCEFCGATEGLTSDHVMPISRYRSLRLDIDNLQLLCGPCNSKKGAKVLLGRRTIKLLFLLWRRDAFFTAFLVGSFVIGLLLLSSFAH